MFSPSSPTATSICSQSTNRLSKPRTIASPSSSSTLKSTGLDCESDIPAGQATKTGETSDATVVPSGGDWRSRRDSRHKLRAHLFGSSQESLQEDVEEDSENKKGLADAARGVRDRLSRTGSAMSRRASLRLSITPQNSSQSRLSLVQESNSMQDLEDSERIADEIKEKAFHDSLAAVNHVSSPVDEDMHVDAIASPIRRSSLYTPGLATRVPNDILRKPPPLEERVEGEADHEYYYNPNRPESSPLSKLAALDRIDQHRSSPVPRASTPADLDYGHLGGLRLGTLRITNGDSPPVLRSRSPNAACEGSTPTLEDYFTTVDVTHSADDDASTGTVDFLSRTGKRQWVMADGERARRVGSPLKRQIRAIALPERIESTNNLLKQPRPTSIKTFSAPEYSFMVAEDYISELPESPYSTSDDLPAPALPFAPTTKANEFDDRLFDEDNAVLPSSRSHSNSRTSGNDPYENHIISTAQKQSLQDCDTTDRLTHSVWTPEKPDLLPLSANPESSNSNLMKADSGYSSNTSTKSLKRRTLSIPNGNSTLRSAMRSSLKAPISPGGPQDMPRSDCGLSPPARPPPPIPSLLAQSSLPLGNETTCFSTQTSTEPVPTMVFISSTSSPVLTGPRKLKKLRPISLPQPVGAIVVQSQREIDGSNIPPVSAEVASRHEERLRYFPSLEHTFPSSQHTGLRESYSSPDLVFVPIRFPSPAHSSAEDYFSLPIHDVAHTLSTVDKQRSSYSRNDEIQSSKSEYRLSLNHQIGDFSIADFGDVTASLGSSAYDVARSTINTTLRAPTTTNTNANITHPHHMTTASPRAKSGMDEEQAVQFVRMRSQLRNQSLTVEQSTSSWPNFHTNPDDFAQRPTCLSIDYPTRPPPPPPVPSKDLPPPRTSFNDRGGIPGKMPKPNTAALPPLPPMPPRELAQQREEVVHPVSTQFSATAHAQASSLLHTCSRCGNTEPINPGQKWDAQFQAWSDRRKLANETLQNPKSSKHKTQNTSSAPSAPISQNKGSAAILQFPDSQTLEVPCEQTTYHPPPTPPHSLPTSNNNSTTSLKDDFTPSGPGVQRHSGRFEGGLAFGYEPGYGLGGSAGTRGMKTDASRKSVDVSRGYGIDLSDVPIFVAPSM